MNFFSILRDQYTNLPLSLTEDTCRGRTYIVTGSNTGLGYECVKHLVRLGSERVIMAVRNTKAGNDAARAIVADLSAGGKRTETKLEVWELDLARFASVQAFAQRVEKNLERVDAVIENAALAAGVWQEGEQGWDTTMTVNVVSTMLLTVLLIPHLRASGRRFGIVPRISIIGSLVGFTPPGKEAFEKLDKGNILEDIANREKWESSFSGYYPFSKLLLFLCYRQLTAATPVDRSGVVINYVNPGICYTGLNRNASTFSPVNIQVVVARVIMGRTSEMGSRTLIHGAAAGEECHGKFVSECQAKEQYVPDWVNDEVGQKAAAQIWKEMSATLQKIAPGSVEAALRFR